MNPVLSIAVCVPVPMVGDRLRGRVARPVSRVAQLGAKPAFLPSQPDFL